MLFPRLSMRDWIDRKTAIFNIASGKDELPGCILRYTQVSGDLRV